MFIVSIVSNTASSDLHQKIASFMEIYWHYLWTLSRVHGSDYGTCSKCLYFLATPRCSASCLLGQTLGWVNRANDRKDRLFQSSQGFWCPLVHNTLQVPHNKNPERWNPANVVTSSRRRKGRKSRPLKRSSSQARLSRDVRVWVAGPSSWNDCWLSVPAHFEFRARKKHLSTAMYRRVITVTVSPATFKSERWLQARVMRTRGLKINARLAHLTRQEVKAHF